MVPQKNLNPLASFRRESGLTRRELAVLVDPSNINAVLQGILQLEMGAKVPPYVKNWPKISSVLRSMGMDLEKFERELAEWAGRQGEAK